MILGMSLSTFTLVHVQGVASAMNVRPDLISRERTD